MHFDLVDRVLEQTQERIVTLKHVSAAEEYLQDHFPSFPVLPGVMMLEAMVQAGRRLVDTGAGPRLVLGRIRALKYGNFVKPGASIRVTVERQKDPQDGTFDLKGEVLLVEPGVSPTADLPVAASGRFSLRPVKIG